LQNKPAETRKQTLLRSFPLQKSPAYIVRAISFAQNGILPEIFLTFCATAATLLTETIQTAGSRKGAIQT